WIQTIATNLARDLLRRQQRHSRVFSGDEPTRSGRALWDSLAPPSRRPAFEESPERPVAAVPTPISEEALEHALERIPDPTHRALLRGALEGRSLGELAQEL